MQSDSTITEKKTDRLVSEGKIIERKGAFYEKGEDFITMPVSPELLVQKVREFPYASMKVSMNHDLSRQVFNFSHPYFKARLWYKGTDAESAVYSFRFLNWKNHNGGVYGYYEMNMLQTAVEKMFLSLDSDTQVKTRLLEIKTSHKFF